MAKINKKDETENVDLTIQEKKDETENVDLKIVKNPVNLKAGLETGDKFIDGDYIFIINKVNEDGSYISERIGRA